MNPIMGKLGNGVAQLLTPAATKAGAGDAATAVATTPTAFAALLSNVAAPVNVPGFVPTEPKPAAPPNAAPPAGSTIVQNPDLLVAGLPLTDIPRSIPSNLAQSDAPAVADAASRQAASPETTDMPGDSMPAPAITLPASLQPADPLAFARAASPKSKKDVETEPEEVTGAATEKEPESSDIPIVKSPDAADPVPPITTLPVITEVPPVWRSDSRPAPATVPDGADRASARIAEVQFQADGVAVRAAPKQLPPEFAAALAASTGLQAKPVADKRDESVIKAPAMKIDTSVVATAASPKSRVAPPVFNGEHLRAQLPDVSSNEASSASSNAQLQPLTAPSTPSPAVVGGTVADLSASLGQQVIDLGSGGQWIDGLAREIVSLSKGEGHGSFRLSPEHLGPIRVDIRPGDQGANVTLTVETKAAESMLLQDRNILKADAQLAAVKIGDVTVERVSHVHEPSRTDTATGQGTGQGQSQTPPQTASQGNNGQGSSNTALAQGQGQSQHNGNHAGNRKVSADAAVSSQAEPRDAGERDIPDATRRARYA